MIARWGWHALATAGLTLHLLQAHQTPLGWGALVFVLACGALLARGLAGRGYGGGQPFVTGSLLLIGGAILLFVAYPILSVLVSAVRDNDGGFAPALFLTKLTDRSIWSLDCLTGGSCGVAWNSLAVATLVGAVTTLLGLAFALLAVRTDLPLKPLLRGLSILPIVTPPFVIGLALILLFGRAGWWPTGSPCMVVSRAADGFMAFGASASPRYWLLR